MTPELSDYDLLLAVRKLPRILVSLMKEYPGRIFVAGGYLRSVITSDPINDIDVFCDTPELARACAGRVADEHKKKLIETNNAFTIYTRPHPIQFIHRWTFKEPGECVASFDFTIARAAIWWDEPKEGATFIYGAHWCSTCDERFYPDLAARRLVYCSPVRIEEAGGSLLRVLKFYQHGYRIPMDSLGTVLARITASIDFNKIAAGEEDHEERLAMVITGLLREVDPLIDPDHISHLASHKGSDDGR